MIFHNFSNHDYHFIIKELAKEFEEQFKCLGENTEKYITFSVPIKKELDNSKRITYKLKFIDSFRFMSSSLLNLVDNLSESVHSDKCIDCKSCLDYMSVKDDQLILKCSKCNKNHNKSYEYMDSSERFDEILLPNKEDFYSSLNMEGITDVDYRHVKKVFKEFKINNVGDYHDLYVQSDTILLAGVFENFRN